MGRKDNSVVTYGRHRQRVVATDVWSSDDEKKKHVFSFSSGSISLSSTDSDGSVLAPARNINSNTNRITRSCKKDSKSTKKKGVNKENRYSKKPTRAIQKGKRFTVFSETDKDSCSSAGGESLASSEKPVNRRVLRDRNIPNDSSVSSIPSPVRQKRRLRPTRKKAGNKDSTPCNFSEFDDYSLLVSSTTPLDPRKKAQTKPVSSGIETSTPFRDTLRKKSHIVEEIKDADFSMIDPVEDSPVVSGIRSISDSPHSSSDVSHMHISNYAASPSIFMTSVGQTDIEVTSSDSNSRLSGASLKDCCIKINKLEESINNMHIDDRSHKCDSSLVESFQQSQSLFDSPMESISHLSKNLTDSSRQVRPYMLVQLKKLRESFIESELRENSTSPFRTNAPCTRSSANRSDLEKRYLESTTRNIHPTCGSVSNNDSEGSEVSDEEGSGKEFEESGSCSEETDEDLSDIFEDEEEERSSEEEHVSEEDQSSNLEETRYILTGKGVNADWSGEMTSLNLSEVRDMDASQDRSPMIQKTVYYSAESDGSLYHTVDGSSLLREEKSSNKNPRNKQLNRTCEDGNLSRSFVEMLTPSKKRCRSAPPPPSPRSKLLHMCEQTEPLSFHNVIPDNMMKKIVKIGEGVYGEVFRAQRSGKSVAIKIIPIEGDFEVNDEPQKTFAEILPEVVISKELSSLRHPGRNTTPSFCEVISAACVRGSYPDHLLKEWDIYNKRRKSENDRPDMFDENQLFIVFEFADGGSDLDSYQFASPWQARSVLQQVCVSLAVAEEELEFEHRDLHIGNVLVGSTDMDDSIEYCLADGLLEVDSHGVRVSIIDFTLSRLRKDGCTVFCDLAKDDALFEGTGDYQFDIYRNMKEENKNEWEMFNPHSNILWLHYLSDKLVKQKKYKRNGREDRESMRYLRQFHAEVLTYHSAKHLILDSELFQT